MKKKLLALVAVLGLALFTLSACGNKTTSSSNKTSIKIGYVDNAGSVALGAIAKYAGYFEEEGLKVKLVKFTDGPSIVAALQSGSVDFGEFGSGPHTLVAKGKAQVVMFDSLSTGDKVIANKKSGITKMSDLKGKKVAIVAGTTSQAILDAALSKAGMKESDVKLVSMSADAIYGAMTSGKVDAAADWTPGTDKILKALGKNAVVLAKDSDFTDTTPFIGSWVTSPDFAKKNAATVVKFQKALLKAQDYRYNKGKNVNKWIAKQLAEDEADVKAELSDSEKLYSSKQIKSMLNSGELLKMYKMQENSSVKFGMLKDDGNLVKPSEFVLTDLMKKAFK